MEKIKYEDKTSTKTKIRAKNGVKKYKCPECDIFKRADHLKTHIAAHKNFRFSCPVCNMKFSNSVLVKKHQGRAGHQVSKIARKIKLQDKEKIGQQENDEKLKIPITASTSSSGPPKQKRINCRQCNFSACNRKTLARHQQMHQYYFHKCRAPSCIKNFKSFKDLQKHRVETGHFKKASVENFKPKFPKRRECILINCKNEQNLTSGQKNESNAMESVETDVKYGNENSRNKERNIDLREDISNEPFCSGNAELEVNKHENKQQSTENAKTCSNFEQMTPKSGQSSSKSGKGSSESDQTTEEPRIFTKAISKINQKLSNLIQEIEDSALKVKRNRPDMFELIDCSSKSGDEFSPEGSKNDSDSEFSSESSYFSACFDTEGTSNKVDDSLTVADEEKEEGVENLSNVEEILVEVSEKLEKEAVRCRNKQESFRNCDDNLGSASKSCEHPINSSNVNGNSKDLSNFCTSDNLKIPTNQDNLKPYAFSPSKKRLICLKCRQNFEKVSNFYRHSREFHDPIQCPKCDRTFIGSRKLSKHKMIHNRLVSSCSIGSCRAVFASNFGLKHHQMSVHGYTIVESKNSQKNSNELDSKSSGIKANFNEFRMSTRSTSKISGNYNLRNTSPSSSSSSQSSHDYSSNSILPTSFLHQFSSLTLSSSVETESGTVTLLNEQNISDFVDIKLNSIEIFEEDEEFHDYNKYECGMCNKFFKNELILLGHLFRKHRN